MCKRADVELACAVAHAAPRSVILDLTQSRTSSSSQQVTPSESLNGLGKELLHLVMRQTVAGDVPVNSQTRGSRMARLNVTALLFMDFMLPPDMSGDDFRHRTSGMKIYRVPTEKSEPKSMIFVAIARSAPRLSLKPELFLENVAGGPVAMFSVVALL